MTTTDPLRPMQPWLHDFEVTVHGNVTCVSEADGDLGTIGTGLYVDDRRVLRHAWLRCDAQRPSRLAALSLGERSRHHLMVRHLGDSGPDPTVAIHRSRTLVDSGAREDLHVHSRANANVTTKLSLFVAGDGADLGAVKGGQDGGALLNAEVTEDGLTWTDGHHRTRIRAPGACVAIDAGGGGVLTWRLTLAPGSVTKLHVTVDVERTASTTFDAGAGTHLVDWSGFGVRAMDRRLELTVGTAVADLSGLLQTDPEDPEDVFAAAGSPWYLTLFGRDALWTARLAILLGTDLARGTLRALARRQGRVTDPATAEQPGKILHEVRRSTFDDRSGTLHLPPVYYGTIDATPLWVTLLHEAWSWGMPDAEVASLRPHLDRALEWMRQSIRDSPDGFLRYHDATGTGLTNQGWKDSGDSMRRRDGSIASAPIALIEPQAYAVDAALRAADLTETIFGDSGDELRSWAADLTARVRKSFWVDDEAGPYLAMALDGEGSPVDGVGSNMGHVLGTGALTPTESSQVATRLGGPDLLGPFGIGTLGRSNPAFNPVGYHTGSVWTHDNAICARGLASAGSHDAASATLRALLEAVTHFDYRMPELFGGDVGLGRPVPYPASCRPQAWSAASAISMVSTALGIEADVPRRRLRLAPLRPAPFGALHVSGIKVAGEDVTVTLDAEGVVCDVRAPDWLEVTVAN